MYQEDKERILSKFVPIKEFNKVIEEIEALNNEYEDEFYRYVKLYDLEDFEEDNEARDEIKITLVQTNTVTMSVLISYHSLIQEIN